MIECRQEASTTETASRQKQLHKYINPHMRRMNLSLCPILSHTQTQTVYKQNVHPISLRKTPQQALLTTANRARKTQDSAEAANDAWLQSVETQKKGQQSICFHLEDSSLSLTFSDLVYYPIEKPGVTRDHSTPTCQPRQTVFCSKKKKKPAVYWVRFLQSK